MIMASHVNSKVDDVTKYIIEDELFGKNEVSVIRKPTKTVICVPTQTNCKMGCVFCHLTGTNRQSKNLSAEWITEAVGMLVAKEDIGNDILISYMGVGEPLLNLDGLTGSINTLFGRYDRIRFGVCTMIPNLTLMEELTKWLASMPAIRLKLHLSIHGINSRSSIIKSKVFIADAIYAARELNLVTGAPLEYHYTLVDGINDSIDELAEFSQLVSDGISTVKFLTLNPANGCLPTKLQEDEIRQLFPNNIIEFYDPPGRDIGSSCGMFDKELYNE